MKRLYKVLGVSSFLLLLGLCMGSLASAAPARTDLQTFTQPSGVQFQARLQGDEFLNWAATPSGEILVRDSNNYWNYAELEENRPTASGRKFGMDTKPSSAINKADMEQLFDEHPEEFKAPALDSSVKIDNNAGSQNNGPSLQQSVSATGNQKILVLLVEFSNIGMQYSESEWSNTFFGTTGKTVRNYYNEISNGRLTFLPATESSGTADDGVIKVALNYAHAAKIDFNQGNAIVHDALVAADPYINFASYDTNGNGAISNDELHIVTILAGYEESYGDTNLTAWGVTWSLSDENSATLDGKIICNEFKGGKYTQQGERHGNHRATIGILVHELGHMLGLPDLYDYDSSSTGVGQHSLMAFGSWASLTGEYIGTTPTHMDAWSKVQLGFVDPLIAKPASNTPYTLKSISTGGYNVVKLPTSVPEQYFLIENRQKEGYDASLTVNGGIAIWQIDDTQPVNSDDNRRLVDLKFFNSNNPYYYVGNVTDFGPTTTPNSNRYAMGNGYDKRNTGIQLSVASSSSSNMVVNVSGTYDNTPPMAPVGMTTLYTTASSVGFSWDPSTSTDTDYYKVYSNGNFIIDTDSTQFKGLYLQANSTYTYSVKSVDRSGNISAVGTAHTATTSNEDNIIIYYKRGFAAPNISYSRIYGDEIWHYESMQQAEIAGYNKIIIPVSGLNGSIIAGKIQNGSGEWDDANGRGYFFEPGVNVIANGFVSSDLPNGADAQAPAAPTNLATTGKTDTTVSLSWTASTDNVGVTGYDIYQGTAKVGTTASASYNVTGLSRAQRIRSR
ncbi:M6 family metalloprotease domain-containing protein [Cohnella faecalis]|uniref:M6 family metalloprotease domain-containing protein n=1 Tax=Cohnella faecalis TaxID=2315694 RepID=A0A398CWT3_9BACL|nr:M6 family metalloprotease domain-containing protein [Cohnella faecalis]RIE03474.1 M6 family metalloprotease domain-containing protein [Cohnella faecalis]